MNMFLLIPSIVFFFVYRALMRRSDKLTDASRTAQTNLGLSLPRCGAMGWGMIALSTVFFVMIVLQYGCVFLGLFEEHEGRLLLHAAILGPALAHRLVDDAAKR